MVLSGEDSFEKDIPDKAPSMPSAMNCFNVCENFQMKNCDNFLNIVQTLDYV